MVSRVWLIGLGVVLLLVAAGMGFWVNKLNTQLQNARAESVEAHGLTQQKQVELEEANALLDQSKADLAKAKTDLAKAKTDLAKAADKSQSLREDLGEAARRAKEAEAKAQELLREKEKVSDARKKLEQDMKKAIRNRDVTISQLQGKLTVNILSQVMFGSGKAELKDEGKEVLSQIGAALKQMGDRHVLVVGHTDNIPTNSTKYLYPTNWELSAARATAAARFLTEDCGVDPTHIGATGCGEYRPVADNSIPEGRAQNRRIAVIILAEDLLGVEKQLTPRPE